ncbi:hypothetical protein H8A97_20225 [Bradyrhizobium sp. Arg62]|nr:MULTISPECIES: hypothetical protein [Bradyrhizobium]MCC8935735.1 hypothetical protein [Bradyrhizobium ivorense]MCC8947380.1 hypothetical protein [Bradyrhizobium brasilense]
MQGVILHNLLYASQPEIFLSASTEVLLICSRSEIASGLELGDVDVEIADRIEGLLPSTSGNRLMPWRWRQR